VRRSGLPVLVTSDSGVLAGCRGAEGTPPDPLTTGAEAVLGYLALSGEASVAAKGMALAASVGATSLPSPDPLSWPLASVSPPSSS